MASALALLGLASAVAACFAGYNSAWGQSKAAQKRLAADTTGHVTADNGGAPATARHTKRVRFRPDGQNERGLSVFQISMGAASLISPAPRSLATSAAAN